MNDDLFRGKLVRLKAVDPQAMAEAYSRWAQDSEYWRLMAAEFARPLSVRSTLEWLEEELCQDPPAFTMFAIHTLADDRLIGEIGLEDDDLPLGETLVALGLGDRQDWGKGYGGDALRIMLRYVFGELNLQRVSLTVSEYNTRGIRSYRKAGFVEEGRVRGAEQRAGRRYDLVYMGLLREEWAQAQGEESGDPLPPGEQGGLGSAGRAGAPGVDP